MFNVEIIVYVRVEEIRVSKVTTVDQDIYKGFMKEADLLTVI